jgi:hypothetical protein
MCLARAEQGILVSCQSRPLPPGVEPRRVCQRHGIRMANVLRLMLPETCLIIWVLMRHVLRTGACAYICFPSEHPALRLRGSIKICKRSSEEQYVLPPCKGLALFHAHPNWFDFFHFNGLVLVIQVLPWEVAPDWDHFLCVVDLHGGIAKQLHYWANVLLV